MQGINRLCARLRCPRCDAEPRPPAWEKLSIFLSLLITQLSRALGPEALELLADHTELFKQFSENPQFKRWLTDMVFDVTYRPKALPPKTQPVAQR